MPLKGLIDPDHIPVNKYELNIVGMPTIVFTSVSGLETEVAAIDLPDRTKATGGQPTAAELTAHGGYIIHGRSDAVLNPGGVRIGTAEIYRQVEHFDEIIDAVCVGQQWQDDVRVVLFVIMREASELDDELIDQVRLRIRHHASPRHMPAKVIAVADIPRTMSGKIAELAVRDVIHGRPVKNTSALANPEALQNFENLEQLQS